MSDKPVKTESKAPAKKAEKPAYKGNTAKQRCGKVTTRVGK